MFKKYPFFSNKKNALVTFLVSSLAVLLFTSNVLAADDIFTKNLIASTTKTIYDDGYYSNLASYFTVSDDGSYGGGEAAAGHFEATNLNYITTIGVKALGSTGVYGQGDTGVYGFSTYGQGVIGNTSYGSAIYGYAYQGNAIYANSSSGFGLYASAPKNYFSGMVGIGTTIPTGKIDIRSTAAGNQIVFSGKAITTTLSDNNNDSGSGALIIGSSQTTAKFRLLPYNNDIYFQNTNTAGNIHFTGNNASTLTGNVIFNTSGNVGIGTTNPVAKLEVSGGNKTSKIFKDVYTAQPDYKYFYLKLFKVVGGAGGDAVSFNGNICVLRSNDNGVSQCSNISVSRGHESIIRFSQLSNSTGVFGTFKLVTLNHEGYDWVTLLFDSHTSAGIKNWTIDGVIQTEATDLSLTNYESSTAVHSSLVYTSKGIVLGEGDISPALLQVNPTANTEGVRIITSNYSPFVIRNASDTADIFRIDQNGNITGGIGNSSAWTRVDGTGSLYATNLNDKVGIGTTGPTNKLSVAVSSPGDGFGVTGSGSNSPQFSLYNGTSQRAAFGTAFAVGHYSAAAAVGDTVLRAFNSSGSKMLISNQQSGGIAFASGSTYSNDTVKMFMSSGGYLGIGTTGPSRLLDVRGAVNLGNTAPSVSPGGYADIHLRTYSGAANSPAKIQVVDYYTDFYSTYADGFRFRNYSSDGVPRDLMVIQNNTSNVGIGTTNPNKPLMVVGSNNQESPAIPKILSVADSSDNTKSISLGYSSAYDVGVIQSIDDGTSWKRTVINPASGSVGINTFNPSNSYALDVNGYVNSTGLCISGNCKTYWSQLFSVDNGVSFNNLTVENLVGATYGNNFLQDLLAFNAPSSYEVYNGSSWTAATVPVSVFDGRAAHEFNDLVIPNGTPSVRFTWNNFGYRYWDALSTTFSANANNFSITVQMSTDGSNWNTMYTTPNYGGWPGYAVYKFAANNGGGYNKLRIILNFNWASSNAISIGNIGLMGSYGGYQGLYNWDYDKNVSFLNNISIANDVNARSFTYSSDRALKKNIATIESPLAKILKLRGVTFNWKEDNSPSVGLIAQEVEKVFPELVGENNGFKSVQYGNLVAPLIEAVKEQQKEINSLKNRLEALENQQ